MRESSAAEKVGKSVDSSYRTQNEGTRIARARARGRICLVLFQYRYSSAWPRE